MLKKIKKILFLVFLLLIIKNVSAEELLLEDSFVNNLGIEMSYEEITNLKSLGYTDNEINNMREEEFEENKNLHGEVVASLTKYYKTETVISSLDQISSISNNFTVTYEITKEEYEASSDNSSSINKSTTVSTEYKTMTTSIVKINNRYRYRNVVIWKKLPFWKTRDIIAIGIESNKVHGVSSTKRLNAYYTYGDSCDWQTTTSGVWKLSSDGYGVSFSYPSRSSSDDAQFYVEMYFEVDKTNSDTITVLNAYGNYRHGKGTDSSIKCGFSVSYVIGLSVSYDSKYDSMSTAQVTLSGISW